MFTRLCLLTLLVSSALLIGGSSALKCFICNSIDEPSCWQKPPEELAANCSVGRQSGSEFIPGIANPLVCWTQYQDVKGTKVMVRNCGGPESTANGTSLSPECYDRVGSKGIRVTYCKCNTEMCNAAPGLSGYAAVLAACALVASAFGRI